MAVNNERSMNHDMMLGATGRSMHSVTPERGGQVETEWPIARAQTLLRGSWSPPYLTDAVRREAHPEDFIFDYCLRDRVTIVNGTGARSSRTRPVARNQFEANPYPSPLDTTHTSWPDSW